MKSTIRALWGLAVFSLLWTATPASAVAIVDLIDPDPDIVLDLGSVPTPCPSGFTCTTNNLAYQHDITDGVGGFVVAVDTIDSATLEVRVYDDGGAETYRYVLGAATQTVEFQNVPNPGRTDTIILNLPSLADLQADGLLDVLLTITDENAGPGQPALIFDWSRLTAQVTRGTPPPPGQVPEPGVISLLGLGLAGLGLMRLRRRRNRMRNAG